MLVVVFCATIEPEWCVCVCVCVVPEFVWVRIVLAEIGAIVGFVWPS